MSRTEKKCLIASAGTHLFLLALLVFGSAFFVAKPAKRDLPALKVVPGRLVDEALSGGGGNPKVAPSEDRQKGDTMVPQAAPPPVPQPATPPPPRQAKQAPPKTTAKKPEPLPLTPKDRTRSPKDQASTTKKALIDLKPVDRSRADKQRAQAEAEARERARAGRRAANELRKARESLEAGLSSGTAVEVFGTGGEAYANYLQFVKTVYDEAWLVTPDLVNDDAAALVRVTIARSGHVVSSEIIRRSGNSTLDKSVQRALDKVKFVAPFPEKAREAERTFTIEFNLTTKRMAG